MRRLVLCVLLLAPAALAQKWTIQYFYDVDQAQLDLVDLAFPSAQHGVAVGMIYKSTAANQKPKPASLVTSDGGAHWTQVPLSEEPRSLFFLNESLGWMVTEKGIWATEDSGRTWKKISDQQKPNKKIGQAPPLILRLWFLDPQHGFAVGYQKTALETRDGGHTWTAIEEAAKPAANPSFTAYTRIAFAGPKKGLIVGGATPPRRDESTSLPAWMDPQSAATRRQVPTLTLLLQTVDGGTQWISSTAPLFGEVTSFHLAGDEGLTVFGFSDSFEWPSEVYRLDLTTGKSTRAFREKNRRVTDSAIFAGPRAFLAAVEPTGRLTSSPIPGKVRMLTSANLTDWKEMDVDYKAVARSLVLSGPDPDHLWAATDTGMILHLALKP